MHRVGESSAGMLLESRQFSDSHSRVQVLGRSDEKVSDMCNHSGCV